MRAAWRVAGVVVLAAATLVRAEEASPPTAMAVRIDAAIRLDGVLDETAWSAAQPIRAFVQREPNQGGPPGEDTEVRVLFDEHALYFGVTCRDRTPEAIVSTQLSRDADLEVDDRLTIVLDPFLDRRNGFFFEVNPAGARTDGQISNNVEHRTYEWDGIWDAAARRSGEGWVAEIAIPFKTLRFKPGQTIWGLNVERQIKRRQETDRWASARQDVWITNLAEAGRLTGLEGVRQGLGLDIRPYVSGGEERSDGELKAGLDVVKNVTSSLTGALTVNTDFAETEVDARQVNLTRFPLFFPEKRAFFLEGSGIYEVAGLGATNTDLIPFFSRRIGLLEGEEVPILAGVKFSGRAGDYNIGFLDVRTRERESDGLPGTNMLAARVSRNLFRQSWVGLIATHGDPRAFGSNTLVGADARFATSSFQGGKNLSLDVYAFRTDDETTRAADHAYGFKLDYPNDLWDVALSMKRIGDAFAPALGFVPRTGIRKTSLGIAFQPRPGRFGIRQFFFELRPLYITRLDGRVENWQLFTAPLNLLTESGEHLEWNWSPEFEHLPASFEIRPGLVIPAGSYRWTRYRAEVNTATKRRWVVDVELGWGGFYEGDNRKLAAGLTLKPSTHLSLSALTEINDVSLPQGGFVSRIFSVRLDTNFSPDLSWANLLQYDNESRLLGVQSRFRWTLRPGNDLFFVLNRGWLRDDDGRYLPRFDEGSAKLQVTFRL